MVIVSQIYHHFLTRGEQILDVISVWRQNFTGGVYYIQHDFIASFFPEYTEITYQQAPR
jgi:hypothetical protein